MDDTGHRTFVTLNELRTTIGIGKTKAYELARCNELLVPAIRVGCSYLFSRRALDEVLSRKHETAA